MSPIWGGVYETMANGGLGIAPTSPVGTVLAVGPCSLGADNTLHYYQASDAKAIREELGAGDLSDRLLDFFLVSGPKAKAIVVPANKDIAAVIRAVTKAGTGTATGAAGGSPAMAAQMLIEILVGGDFGEATFRWSVDGGDTWENSQTVPLTPGEAITLGPCGTFAFSDPYAGPTSFVAGDTWSWEILGPSCTLAKLLAAIDVAVEAKLPFEGILVATPTGAASWVGFDTLVEGLFDEHAPLWLLTEAPLPTAGMSADAYVTARLGDIVSFSSDRVMVAACIVETLDQDAYALERGLSGIAAGMIAGQPVYRSIGHPQYCRLSPVLRLVTPEKEAQLKTLNEARYIVPRQHVGLTGWYFNDGNIAAEQTSDYQAVELRRVMDNVVRRLRITALKHVHDHVRVVDGVADPAGLAGLEGDCKDTLLSINDTFSSARIEIPTGQDVITNQAITATISVVPFGYLKEINLTFRLVKL